MDLEKKKSLSKEDDDDERSCAQCNSTKTPLWRAGPDGPKTLCNACGIKYRKTIIIPAAVQSLNKIRKPKPKSHSNPSSSSPSNNAKSRSKSAVQSGSSASNKLGNLRRNLAWGLNSSPLRLQRKVNDRYNKQKNARPIISTSIDTATATTPAKTTMASARKGGDVTEIGKSVKIGLMALGKEVELLQRQRKMSKEEEEAAALLISLSNCGSVMV